MLITMLGQEVSAWLAYTILFCLFSIALIIQSISHWHITPFALYAICIAGGSLYVVLTPDFSETDRPWRDQEPIINQLPIYSILIFAGIIDWQFVYIRFIATALKNHRRWGSLHPVIITEKGDATSGPIIDITSATNYRSSLCDYQLTKATLDNVYALSPSSSSSFLFSSWTFWAYILAIIVQFIVILAFLTCKILITDPNIGALTSAIFISIMTFPAVLNPMAVIYTGSKCHSKLVSRIMGQNRQDATILFLIPILFMFVMSSTTTIAWIAYTRPDPMMKPFEDSLTNWILVKAFSVYFPLSILLICCMFKRRKYNNLIEEDGVKRYATRKSSVSVTLLKERPHHHDRIYNNKRLLDS